MRIATMEEASEKWLLESDVTSKESRIVWEGGNGKGPKGTSLVPYFTYKPPITKTRVKISLIATPLSTRYVVRCRVGYIGGSLSAKHAQ